MRRYCKTCKVPKSAPIPGVLEGQKYGNDLIAKMSVMRCMGLSFDKIVDMIYMLYGIHIAKSTATSLSGMVAKELNPVCDGLRDEILQGDKIYCDETGWYLDGKHWWVWGLTTPNIAFYHLRQRAQIWLHRHCLKTFWVSLYRTLTRDGIVWVTNTRNTCCIISVTYTAH